MSSRVRDGFDGIFFGVYRKDADGFDRAASGLVKRGCNGAGAVAVACGGAGATFGVSDDACNDVYGRSRAGVLKSGGSEEGGSEPMLGLSGVRKGDLNGFFKVSVASFSLRRLACGVDILTFAASLGVAQV